LSSRQPKGKRAAKRKHITNRRRPAPHRRHRKHEQGQCRRQPTRQESVRHRGRGRVGRQGRQGTPRAAHSAGCE
jgi:hypothetical protein